MERVEVEAMLNRLLAALDPDVEYEMRHPGVDLALRVEDDGVGPPANDAPRGNGLGNLEARAAAHLGTFTLRPRPGGGTIAEWRVPLAAQPS